MNKIKPQLPSGMRDFLPADVLRRQYVINIVTEVFQTYGYEPLQTPVLELRETLTGKYGEDAERLIYYAQHALGKEKLALRYDLTVPLARAFAQHEPELTLPFKRFQIAPVWRGERPGRGRFREFYQCDADTVGIAGMEADAEVISLVATAIQRLGFSDFRIKINNRKVLTGIGQYAGLTGAALSNLYRSIDKLDKIGADGVKDEMIKGGIAEDTVAKIAQLLLAPSTVTITGYTADHATIAQMQSTLAGIEAAQEGLRELDQLFEFLQAMHVDEKFIELDFSMVRGLGYYTGPIFETVLVSDDPEERVGSVSGGGRYDDLIGLFRKESLPTVGVSLGIERLMALMDKRKLYPADLKRTVVDVLVTVFGSETRSGALGLVSVLRAGGINTELFMQEAKLGKQIGYADKKGIPLVAILGPDEIARGEIKLKRLADQHEIIVPLSLAAESAQALLDQQDTSA
ncbi:MAG: histidine--tRNA ligase [Chloroflexota bacterium]